MLMNAMIHMLKIKIAQSYGSGFFYDNYKYISDTYWDLTQEAEEKISKNQDEIKK